MYSEKVHFELTRRCLLECPKCPRTDLKGNMQITDLPVDIVKTVIQTGKYKKALLSGNLGDPLYHPQLIDIIKFFNEQRVFFIMATNGSGKKLDWWKNFYNSYTDGKIVFGVDGLKDTAHLYRKNINFDDSMSAMKLGSQMGKQIVWQFIPFSFNEHQVEAAQALANTYGITFKLRLSDRWNDADPLRPTNPQLYMEQT